MKKWQKSHGNVFGTVQRKENCIWKTSNVWQILPSEGCRNEIIPVYLCVCHKMPSKWVKPLFNKALCCLWLKTVTQKRGGGKKTKKTICFSLKQKLTQPTQSALVETSQLNVTGPVGRLLLYSPPLLVFLLSFHFLPGASLVSSTVLHLFLFHPPHCVTLPLLSPIYSLLHLGGHNSLRFDIYRALCH